MDAETKARATVKARQHLADTREDLNALKHRQRTLRKWERRMRDLLAWLEEEDDDDDE